MLSASAADNYLRYMALPVGQGALDLKTLQFTREDFDRVQPAGLQGTSIDTDLTRFQARGGELMLYHGWADPLIPPRGTLDYHTRLQDRVGGADATRQFARLFMFPGMFHCSGGGPAPATSDLILDLVNWVEQGQAPDQVIGTQADASGQVVRTRPVYAYSLVARYTGQGSIDDAANFQPAPPPRGSEDEIERAGSQLTQSAAAR